MITVSSMEINKGNALCRGAGATLVALVEPVVNLANKLGHYRFTLRRRPGLAEATGDLEQKKYYLKMAALCEELSVFDRELCCRPYTDPVDIDSTRTKHDAHFGHASVLWRNVAALEDNPSRKRIYESRARCIELRRNQSALKRADIGELKDIADEFLNLANDP